MPRACSTASPVAPARAVVAPALVQGARRPDARLSSTACASSSSTTGAAASSPSATAWPTRTVPAGSTASFYDLLASEARLASFVAIAKGDVPQHHWFHLGRLVTNVDGHATLISWGGTMFEYLMPQLLMRSFSGTLLDQSCRAAVQRQIDYGRSSAACRGASRSRPTPSPIARARISTARSACPGSASGAASSTDLVIAPYATALASQVSPEAAVENLDRLADAGVEGRYGFYESVDYNPRNRGVEELPTTGAAVRPAVVRAYFSHHQGMSLVALANVVCQDVFVDTLPRRPAHPGHGAAAAGAGAARGDPVGAAAGRNRHRAAVAAGLRVAAVRVAAEHQRPHALSVERTLHRRRHQCRRRLQPCGATSR